MLSRDQLRFIETLDLGRSNIIFWSQAGNHIHPNEYNNEMSVAYDQGFTQVMPPEAALSNVRKRVQWKLDKILKRWDKIKDSRMKEWSRENDAW